MLHLQKRYGIYRARGVVNGRFVHKSLETGNAAVAESLRKQLERELLLGGDEQPKEWPAYTENFLAGLAASSVSPNTAKKYTFVVKRFSQFLEDQSIRDVRHLTPAIINQYVAERKRDVHPTKGGRVTQEGVKSDLRILHVVLAEAVESGVLPKNPVKYNGLNTRPGEVVPFTDEEVERMLKWAVERPRVGHPFDLSAIIWVFLNTGLRISDVVNLPKSAITGDWIVLVTRKRQKPVRLPLLPSTKEALARWTESYNGEQKQSPLVFPTRTGKPMRNLDGVLRRLWKRAGIEGGHPHRFRHTFAVRMLRNDAQIYDVAKALAITVAVCERHYAPFVAELEERVQRLVGKLEQLPGTEGRAEPLGEIRAQSAHNDSPSNGPILVEHSTGVKVDVTVLNSEESRSSLSFNSLQK